MKSFFRTVILTGLFVGATDLIAAYVTQFIKTGKFDDKMLYYIAGGGLGLEISMKGGFWIGLLGVFFHFFIAFAFTLFFFLIFPKLKFLWYNKYVVGLLYGLFVNKFMAWVVLPFTALPPNKAGFNFKEFLVGGLVLGIVLGIPIAWSAFKYYGVESKQKGIMGRNNFRV